MKYRFKLPKDSIIIKNTGVADLEKSTRDDSKKTNFLLAYYAEPLFPKVSRLATNKLTETLKKKNLLENFQNDGINKPSIETKRVTAKNFRRNFQLNQIYGYEKDYFRPSRRLRKQNENYYLGSSAFNVKRKLFRVPKTTVRYDRQVVGMVKKYLQHYHRENSIIEMNPNTGEISFVVRNENNPVLKKYTKTLNKPEGYLYLNFSKKNLFVTLTDAHGNCIKKLSSGAEGLKRREKQKPFAVRLLVGKIAKDIVSKGISSITIIFNPNNTYQRWRLKPAMITLERAGVLIKRVQRKVVQQHGGCRKKKSRRI